MLSGWDAGVLAQAFGLDTRQVRLDARLVHAWRAPLDDLLAQLRERHDWSALVAYRYLRTLRRALLGRALD